MKLIVKKNDKRLTGNGAYMHHDKILHYNGVINMLVRGNYCHRVTDNTECFKIRRDKRNKIY